MTVKDLRDLVTDTERWGGDPYRLAMLVREQQREDDAQRAEAHSADGAAAIRAD